MTHLPLELLSILNLMRINFFIGQAPVHDYMYTQCTLRTTCTDCTTVYVLSILVCTTDICTVRVLYISVHCWLAAPMYSNFCAIGYRLQMKQ